MLDFADGGYDKIASTVPDDEDNRQQKIDSLVKVLHLVMGNIYADVVRKAPPGTIAENDYRWFFEESINTMAGLPFYGSPVFFQLDDFKHVQSSGLQITRSPGKNTVYLGCVMLIIGVFFMFYIHHNRIWVWLETKDGQTRILFAGAGDRDQRGFDQHFNELSGKLERHILS
ncbi:MAG: cytochrome c biogenesis protein ResB [Gammaproteobacteria bacterium]|nr:cytochrome c biogenesis protein ResB [Gammaproteobacteria bacterium]